MPLTLLALPAIPTVASSKFLLILGVKIWVSLPFRSEPMMDEKFACADLVDQIVDPILSFLDLFWRTIDARIERFGGREQFDLHLEIVKGGHQIKGST